MTMRHFVTEPVLHGRVLVTDSARKPTTADCGCADPGATTTDRARNLRRLVSDASADMPSRLAAINELNRKRYQLEEQQ
jgi:hypothetical protein